MNGDGDILGTRRHLEVQPSSSASLGITSGVDGKKEANAAADGSGANAGSGASARSTSGHSSVLNSLKRQRSVGGMPAGIGKSGTGENENVFESAAGEVPVDKLTPEQMKRYQAWKRSRFERAGVREIILDRAAPTLTRDLEREQQGTGALKETSVLAVSAMAKMYVGDLVEEAKLAQLKRGESGPLRPKDLLDARRRLATNGKAPPLCSSSSRAPGSGGTGGIGEVVARGKRLLGGGSTLVRGSAI